MKLIINNIIQFYYLGFKNMTVGKKLWTIIIIKLIIIFLVLKLFFFPDFLKTNFPDSKLIVGGPHATCMPESLVPYFDVVVKGEGEQTILDVVKDYQHARNLPSIYVGRTVEDLDSLPFPARHLVPIHKYHRIVGGERSVGVITARGCPMSCCFCSKVWGKTVRFRSAENVLAEIKEVVGKYGIKGVSFRDDTFTLNKTRLYQMLRGLQFLDVKWRCITRVDQVDERTLMAMKDAGME